MPKTLYCGYPSVPVRVTGSLRCYREGSIVQKTESVSRAGRKNFPCQRGLFRQILEACFSFVDELVDRAVKGGLAVIFAVGLLIQYAVGLVSEAAKFFGQITRPYVGASADLVGFRGVGHVLSIGPFCSNIRRNSKYGGFQAPELGISMHIGDATVNTL